MSAGERSLPGRSYTLVDVAEIASDGIGIWAGLHAADLADDGVTVEAVREEHAGRPGVLVQVGVHCYWLPVYRLTHRKALPDLDLTPLERE